MTASQNYEDIKTNTVDDLNEVNQQQLVNQSRSSSELDGEDFEQVFPLNGSSAFKFDTKLLSNPKFKFMHKQQ